MRILLALLIAGLVMGCAEKKTVPTGRLVASRVDVVGAIPGYVAELNGTVLSCRHTTTYEDCTIKTYEIPVKYKNGRWGKETTEIGGPFTKRIIVEGPLAGEEMWVNQNIVTLDSKGEYDCRPILMELAKSVGNVNRETVVLGVSYDWDGTYFTINRLALNKLLGIP